MDLASGGLAAALALGLLLGLRHATDADHVVAVSTMASEERNALRGLWIGVSWGMGHSTPLMILGVIILLMKDVVLDAYGSVAPFLEFGVGVMLVFLGVQVFWRLRQNQLHLHEHRAVAQHPHMHVHSHSESSEQALDAGESHKIFGTAKPFFRLKSYIIGVVHGLAGSAAVMLILLPQVASFWAGIGYILLFSLGTMISMGAITIFLGIPFAVTGRFERWNFWVARVAGAGSFVFGLALMADLAMGTHILGFLPE